MVIVIVIVAAVTVVLSTALIAAAISVRPSTPCLFDGSIVYTQEGRYDGGNCTGKPENVYVSWGGPTQKLHEVRVCNGHLSKLMDVADQLIRESAPLR